MNESKRISAPAGDAADGRAIATQQEAPQSKRSVKEAVEAPEFKRELTRIIGDAMGADRAVRMVVTSISRTPSIGECTPRSVMNAVYQAYQLGLPLDGRHAHLVPFSEAGKKVCVLIPDYKGLIQLALKSKLVTGITLEIVCENDVFEWDRGAVVRHSVDWRSERGQPYAAYALARMAGGGEISCVISKADALAAKARAKKGPKQTPWDTDFNEMWKKTAFKRLAKVLPVSPEFAEADRLDEEPVDVTPKQASSQFQRPALTTVTDHADVGLVEVAEKQEPAPAPVGTEPVIVDVLTTPAHDAIAKAIEEAGATFETLRAVAEHHKFDGAADWTEIRDVPDRIAEKLAKAHVGLVRELKAAL